MQKITSNTSGGGRRKSYSKLTARMARGVVFKKLTALRARDERAADELIDQLLDRLRLICDDYGRGESEKTKTESGSLRAESGGLRTEFGKRKTESGSLLTQNGRAVGGAAAKLLSLIESRRDVWRSFLFRVAETFDPTALATVGVGLVYGGMMTAPSDNSSHISVYTLGKAELSVSVAQMADTLLSAGDRGKLVWIIRGRGAASKPALEVYSRLADCTFLLAEAVAPVGEPPTNVVYLLPKEGSSSVEKRLLASGVPYVLTDADDPVFSTAPKGRSPDCVPSQLLASLEALLISPRLPLTVSGLSELLDCLEISLPYGDGRGVGFYFS